MINKRLVYKTVTAGGWIDAAEVPVAQVVGARIVQALKALEHQFKFGVEVNGLEHIGNLARNFIGSERMIDCACAVDLLGIGFAEFFKTSPVCLVNE